MRAQGQGRAGLLPAGDVLPDQQGGSRDRLPDADLRHVDDQGAARSTTRSSGRSTAARTRPLPQLVTRRPARASAASTATCGRRARGNMQTYVLHEHETDVRAARRHAGAQRRPQLPGDRHGLEQMLPAHLRASGNANYFSSLIVAAALPAEHLRRDQPLAQLRRQRPAATGGRTTISGTVERSRSRSPTTQTPPSTDRRRASATTAPRSRSPACRSTSARTREYATIIRTSKTDLRERVNDRGLTRMDFVPTIRFPFTKLAVPHVQHVGRLPRDLLDREPRRHGAAGRRAGHRAQYFRSVDADHRPGLHARSGTRRQQRLRAEVQARDRADASRCERTSAIENRRQHRQARRHRLRRRRRHPRQLRR